MASHGKVQTHELVARLQAGHKHGHVGLCAAVRLHVGILGVEELLHAVAGDVLALVHTLAAAIVAVARITLGILVGEATAHGAHHLVAHKVFTCNQLHAVQLAIVFFLDDVENLSIFKHS